MEVDWDSALFTLSQHDVVDTGSTGSGKTDSQEISCGASPLLGHFHEIGTTSRTNGLEKDADGEGSVPRLDSAKRDSSSQAHVDVGSCDSRRGLITKVIDGWSKAEAGSEDGSSSITSTMGLSLNTDTTYQGKSDRLRTAEDILMGVYMYFAGRFGGGFRKCQWNKSVEIVAHVAQREEYGCRQEKRLT